MLCRDQRPSDQIASVCQIPGHRRHGNAFARPSSVSWFIIFCRRSQRERAAVFRLFHLPSLRFHFRGTRKMTAGPVESITRRQQPKCDIGLVLRLSKPDYIGTTAIISSSPDWAHWDCVLRPAGAQWPSKDQQTGQSDWSPELYWNFEREETGLIFRSSGSTCSFIRFLISSLVSTVMAWKCQSKSTTGRPWDAPNLIYPDNMPPKKLKTNNTLAMVSFVWVCQDILGHINEAATGNWVYL